MTSKKALLLSGIVASTLIVSACHYKKSSPSYYWQRIDASSSLYLQGPKAQQMLHDNIATCTAEIKELERLGAIRKAIPGATSGKLDSWETPTRDGYLLNEHKDFHDFETCMTTKGWERAEYLPYDDAARARKAYLDRKSKKQPTVSKEEYVRTAPPPAKKPAAYENMND